MEYKIFFIERMYLNRDSIIHTTVILCSQTLNLLKMASNGSFGGCRLRDRDLGPRFFVFYPLGGSLGHPCDQSKHRWSPTCGCTVYNDLCIQVYTTVYNAQVAASMQRRLFGKPRRRISGLADGSHHGQECGFNCTTSCFGLNGTIFHF